MTSFASPLPDVQCRQRVNLLPVKLAHHTRPRRTGRLAVLRASASESPLSLFAIALFAGSWLGNLAGLSGGGPRSAALVLFAGLVPAVEELNTSSFLFIVAALVVALRSSTNPDLETARRWLARASAISICSARSGLIGDVIRMFNVRAIHQPASPCGSCRCSSARIFVAAVRLGQSADREMDQGAQSRDATSHINLARTCSGLSCCRWSGRSSTCAGGAGRSAAPAAPSLSSTRSRPHRHFSSLFGADDDPALADPVQPAVRRADRARRGLSLGQRDASRRYQLRRLRPSRRLSPDRHGAVGRRLRAGGDAARRTGREIEP